MASLSPTHLARFNEAMQSIYGSFETLSPSQVAGWTPPLKSGGHKGRYLWTDSFGVLNFITLSHLTSNPKYLTLAQSLVNSVHSILGYTRDGESRLPGATEEEPLKGGLRIGKLDEEGGDGDGMYHHYLTLWMFALNRLSLATSDPKYNDLAAQLGKAIHPRFLKRGTGGKKRLVWKISMDMQRVLVGSEGVLDPGTGLVVFELVDGGRGVLKGEIQDYRDMVGREGWVEGRAGKDALDLGMGLWVCHFVREGEEWAKRLGDMYLENSRLLLNEDGAIFKSSAQHRLAFREFGTCMGIGCYGGDEYLKERAAAVIEFWEEYMKEVTTNDLRPISLVMYAAALIPGAFKKGFLDLRLQ